MINDSSNLMLIKALCLQTPISSCVGKALLFGPLVRSYHRLCTPTTMCCKSTGAVVCIPVWHSNAHRRGSGAALHPVHAHCQAFGKHVGHVANWA